MNLSEQLEFIVFHLENSSKAKVLILDDKILRYSFLDKFPNLCKLTPSHYRFSIEIANHLVDFVDRKFLDLPMCGVRYDYGFTTGCQKDDLNKIIPFITGKGFIYDFKSQEYVVDFAADKL